MNYKTVMMGLVIAFGLIMLSLFAFYDNEYKKLQVEYIVLKEAPHNDSILVVEYQKSLQIFIDKDPECASKFSAIMDSVNTH